MKKYYYANSQRIAMREGSNSPQWLFSDHLNSTSKIASATGTVSYNALYKAWGETRYTSGTSPTTFKYTGQREEASFGLYYYGARWYDAALGRFVQSDTIVPEGVQGWDRYAYVNNNPVKYNDPSGHAGSLPPIFPNGYTIINMSSWSPMIKVLVSVALAITVDNLTAGRTGLYGDNNWGIIPDAEYINSGAWTVPPAFGGVLSSGDDIARISANVVDDTFSIFKKCNFRKELQVLTSAELPDIIGKEAHHIIPSKFEPFFKNKLINIDDPKYGTWVDAISHKQWSWEYNQRWAQFINENENASIAEIELFAKELAEEYGFEIYFIPNEK